MAPTLFTREALTRRLQLPDEPAAPAGPVGAHAGPSGPEPVRVAPSHEHRLRELIFPAVFMIYLAQTGAGVVSHSSGPAVAAGMVILAAFCACYLLAITCGDEPGRRGFWTYYVVLLALCAAELAFAHQDALVMLVYVAVLTVAARFYGAIPLIVSYMVLSAVLPPLVPSWHARTDLTTALSIGIVSLAMFGFFGVIRTNEALAEARSEVARLATENERSRIARDLHDLLGHSLTTITVKAGLASRLAKVDPDRAADEIAEVEALTRNTLADVRAAVSGYREVTLANELAAAREVLRAAGIAATLPGAIDSVPARQSELFGWVVREGVTNVVRHSRAASCQVRFGPGFVEVVDDGAAAPAAPGHRDCSSDAGHGLLGLRERVAAAGGTLSVGVADEARGLGWRLRAELPA